MTTMYLDSNDIHNWHVVTVRRRWVGFLDAVQEAAVSEAHRRHHREGADADDLARELNRQFGFKRRD